MALASGTGSRTAVLGGAGLSRWMTLGAIAMALAAVLSPAGAFAQGRGFDDRDDRDRDPRDRGGVSRRDNDDLLRTLIESEIHRRETRPTPRGLPSSRVIDQPTREMLDARRVLADIARDADDLATLIYDESRRNPDVRPYVNDMMKLRARVSIISDKARNQNDHMMLVEDLRNLDKDWRILALRLSQIRGLDRKITAYIGRINDEGKDLAQILDIKPQLDRRDLSRLAAQLTSDLGNLLEDISIDLARSQQRDELLSQGRRVRQQSGLLANSVDDNRDYNIVLDDYKQFLALWNPFSSALRPLQMRSLDRHVRRISETNSKMQELLWIPHQMDRQQLLYLTDALKRDVDEFFARTPLKLLIDLPDSRRVLPTAHEFYGVCAHFTDTVQSDDSDEEVIQAFRYIDKAHHEFMDVFKGVNSQAALQVLRQIDQGVHDLQDSLNLQGGSNNRRIGELVALVDNLASHLDSDVRRWVDDDRPPFRSQALQESAAFASLARRIDDAVAAGSTNQVQRDIALLYESWLRLYNIVKKCDTNDRDHLLSLCSQITPAVVELQTLVGP